MKQGRMDEREGHVRLQEFLGDLVTIAPTNLDSKKVTHNAGPSKINSYA